MEFRQTAITGWVAGHGKNWRTALQVCSAKNGNVCILSAQEIAYGNTLANNCKTSGIFSTVEIARALRAAGR